jgi:hypothetical protein
MTGHIMSEIIVGIGCDYAQDLSAEILKYSIQRCTRMHPAFVKLHQMPEWAQITTDLRAHQRTQFSLQRFLLAKRVLDSSADIGIYLDSDMLVLRPIEKLEAGFRATARHLATVVSLKEWRRRPQSSVLVMDREGAALLWASYVKFVEGTLSYEDLIYLRTIPDVGTMEYSWNCLEYLDETTALIHYTDVDTQPWLRDGHPNAGIWYTYLWRFAQDSRLREFVLAEIANGHVRPSLLEVLELGPSLTAFSSYAWLKDLFFVPPHRFRKVSRRWIRTALAPLLRTMIGIQFIASKGQPNVR